MSPRDKLPELLKAYGPSLWSDAKRLRALLLDACPTERREVNLLVAAADEGVPEDLSNRPHSVPIEVLLTRLQKKLVDGHGTAVDTARWAVESWALALNALAQSSKRVQPAPMVTSTNAKLLIPRSLADEMLAVDSSEIPGRRDLCQSPWGVLAGPPGHAQVFYRGESDYDDEGWGDDLSEQIKRIGKLPHGWKPLAFFANHWDHTTRPRPRELELTADWDDPFYVYPSGNPATGYEFVIHRITDGRIRKASIEVVEDE